ncbi:amino acid/amide ABC transporter ATP-binding protein 2, HAAT family [Thermaerobacter marianensis DSM 12885]|uniref:Amino acid/amide ABC transporter ATP-binding protein 2, HAAT family n=1 Tax=Thermaerobacter marianensis (strain ATCC 700841 / DSM 12885 / JCM 10246 / 7p75a) TaxID=644966 RepID=E6SI09_THEM7|nr:ABC transporter ATP-binding protein [Thermaerobacter marianensis]ADU51889.1 amino acid/amide ABC transporter ATP-binding protein 2, HAAT family [Thermaerobacter marianensis DSM 12885]
MLRLVDVYAGYSEGLVLKGLSLEVRERQVVALLGRNGAGKTTALRAIMGLLPIQRGEITWRGEPIHRLQPHQISRRGIALVPQGRRIFPSLTVRENLLIAARQRQTGEEGATGGGWTLKRIYEIFPVLRQRDRIGGTRLSGGEQQMLAIARALMTQPELLLCDEPSEGLAPIMVERVAGVLTTLKKSGLAILLVEQNLEVALSVADYVYIIDDGRVVYQGLPGELARDQATQVRFLGASA